MKLTTKIPLASLLTTVHAIIVTYDAVYDNPSTTLASVACSDGTHGLLSRNFTTFGSLPSYPYIGAAIAVAGYNSPNCGTCWQLTFTNGVGAKKSINVAAIDSTSPGFNIALQAMNDLTGNQAVHLGKVNADAKQVNSKVCGL